MPKNIPLWGRHRIRSQKKHSIVGAVSHTPTNKNFNKMKKIYLLLFALTFMLPLATVNAQTPSAAQNYVRTDVVTEAYTTEAAFNTATNAAGTRQTAIQYMDGLGRPVESVSCGASPSQADIVSFAVYDMLGRTDRKSVV